MLRDYQQRAIDQLYAWFDKNPTGHPVLNMPGGSGKSVVIASLAKDALQIATITDLFAGANWMERETYDFYGIEFTGHPDLRRILNMDDMDYFPMRKEYVLEDGTREDKDDRFFGRNTNEI
jgi:NADH:ubiquinone oxidoreductase subunit C